MPDYSVTPMLTHTAKTARIAGFTLIELSIVLVIIGLIVGGVLVGQDLVRSAAMRAQISQIEKYNSAANTFREKTGYLPGDINATAATQFGLISRGTIGGQGDGDGIIQGFANGANGLKCGFCEAGGETTTFFSDLGALSLIDGNFSGATNSHISAATQTAINAYLPAAKINGNFVYVWSGGYNLNWSSNDTGSDGQNYFGIANVSQLGSSGGFGMTASPGLSVSQAYNIDTKIDDGMPQSGRVMALYVNAYPPKWAGSGGTFGAPYTTNVSPSATSCFDNGNISGNPQAYSIGKNSGSGVNCALSFQFQ